MRLVIDIKEAEFIEECAEAFQNKKTTIIEDVYDVIKKLMLKSLNEKYSPEKILFGYKPELYDDHLSLKEYIEDGYQDKKHGICLWYFSFELFFTKEMGIEIQEVVLPEFFVTPAQVQSNSNVIKDETGVRISINLSSIFKNIQIPESSCFNSTPFTKALVNIKLSNQKKHTKININSVELVINEETCVKILEKLKKIQFEQILLPSKLGGWQWRQTFYDKIFGDIFFCGCFKNALEKDEITDNFMDRFRISKPQDRQLRKGLERKLYKENICHICTGQNSDLIYCHKMYGSIFKVKYGAYIKKIAIEREIDEKDAENIVREMKGVAKIGEKWVNETLLYNYIKILFPEHEVIREASPLWLERQRLDIFIPELNLAIEYQGQQHYNEIKHFGGKEGLKKAIERDQIKSNKCKKNGVKLIYFTYKENISEKLVEKKLSEFIKLCER
jgi:hypothetical protein